MTRPQAAGNCMSVYRVIRNASATPCTPSVMNVQGMYAAQLCSGLVKNKDPVCIMGLFSFFIKFMIP